MSVKVPAHLEPYGPYWVEFNFTDTETGVTELIKHTYATEFEAIRCTGFQNYSNVKLVAHSDNIDRSKYRY
ncbi:hypothetical protein ACFYZ4_15045 [Streptomyces sp. NPDC001513]|uniref:hypothetical protein n=1 Tax=Streptomyces sp. NPDC001513 TaxID=3364580 RepID=UPI0036B77EE8